MRKGLLIALTVAALGLLVAGSVGAAGRGRTQSNGTLSAAEVEGLQFMREEEKLARDVYAVLFEKWNVRAFSNIARSEQKHMDSLKALLDRYGLEDPAMGKEAGEFADAQLQALYEELVVRGTASLEDALAVGGAIEEIDILDLRERIAQSDQSDVLQVYGRLLSGSYNHLRAFASQYLQEAGEVYAPQYLSAEEYAAVVERSLGQSGNRGGGRSG